MSLDKDYKYDSDSPVDGIEITKSLTVDGKGHTIDGADNYRIFKIYSDIVLKNIVFMNANASTSGGVLYLEHSNAQIINCSFLFNNAKDMGGAIYLNSSNINVSDSTFANNTCHGLYTEGGAIYAVSSNGIIENSKFHDNYADAGGAINVFNTILKLKTNDFVNNTAKWYGGAVFSDFTVKKAKVKVVAKKKTFKKSKKVKKYTVTLKNNLGNALKKVSLKLKIKGKTYSVKTNSKGKATFKIKKSTKKGTFKAKISFKGNKYYYAMTKTVKIKVK